jgi:hypothetical protein
MSAQQYKMGYRFASFWNCSLEIDEEFQYTTESGEIRTCKQDIVEMVEFWTGWESRLDDCDGDYTKAFLKQLARKILCIVMATGYNTGGIIEEFEELEGWQSMDGSKGIAIIDMDDYPIDHDDFYLEGEEC